MNILLVEGMAELSRRARRIIATSGFASRVHTIGDSTETLAYLRREAPYRAAPKPDLVLLGLSQSLTDNCLISDEIATNPRLVGVELVTLEDPRLNQVVGDDPKLMRDFCELKTVELPALGELIDTIGSGSLHFSRAVGML